MPQPLDNIIWEIEAAAYRGSFLGFAKWVVTGLAYINERVNRLEKTQDKAKKVKIT
jgi:hypothetical protein